MNWQEIFGTNWGNVGEVMLRGTVTYIAILVILRVARRESGTFSIPDLIVIVVVADAAQNAMAGQYNSVTEGVILVVTIVGWSFVMDFLSYRWDAFQRVLTPAAVVLVRDGQPIRRNLRQNLITMDELEAQLRANGLESLDDVKRATLESDGAISVVPLDGDSSHSRRNVRHGV
ncbi:DUF421 domain-containing protein [bacterium]|nr:DUF421 domain-containing protein [bacterium]